MAKPKRKVTRKVAKKVTATKKKVVPKKKPRSKLSNDRIHEQTRHDVAASVERHDQVNERASTRILRDPSEIFDRSSLIDDDDDGEYPDNLPLEDDDAVSSPVAALGPEVAASLRADSERIAEIASAPPSTAATIGATEYPIAPELPSTGNEDSTSETCVCGHAVEEHGNDDAYPGSTACSECPEGDCIAYESEG